MKYWFIFCKTDIVLEKREDGTYTIPCSEECPIETKPWTHILNITPMEDGTEVKTFTIPEPITDNPKYEMCGLRPSFYKLSPALYQKAGKCQELNYWDQNTNFCGVCGAPMEMATDISKKCTNCGKQVWPSLATAIIVLIHKGDEVLLVHARNFKGNFDSLVAGFVETGESLEEAVHREVMEENRTYHYQYQILRFPAVALSKRTDDRFYSRLRRWGDSSSERRTLPRKMVQEGQPPYPPRETFHRQKAH